MLQSRVRTALIGAVVSASAAVGVVAPAQAAVYSGSWDPLFGSSSGTPAALAGVDSWLGEATFYIPDQCVISNGTVSSCAFGSMTAGPATATLTGTGSPAPTDLLSFNQVVAVSDMVFANSVLVGVDAALFTPVSGHAGFDGSGTYSFTVGFSATGASLYYCLNGVTCSNSGSTSSFDGIRSSNDDGDDRDDDDNNTCRYPSSSDGNTASCGVSSTVATVTYTALVPEPQTYALMLAGLGAIGFVARRRRS